MAFRGTRIAAALVWRATILLGLMNGSGCDKSSTSATKPASSSTATTTRSASAASPAAAAPVERAGSAYLATLAGVTLMEDGKIQPVQGIDEKLAELSRGDSGAVYTAGTSVYAIHGALAEKTELIGSGLSVGADGTLYLPGLSEPRIELLRRGNQETWDLPASGYFVAASPTGEIIAGDENNRFYERKESKWVPIELDADHKQDRAHSLEAGADGTLYAIFEEGVAAKPKGGSWKKVPLEHGRVLGWGEPSSNGLLPLSTDEGIIVVGDDNAKPLTYEAMGTSKGSVESIGVDDQKRRWVGTPDGLKVFDRDGKLLQAYPPGTLPGPVHAILIVGNGPALPPTPEAVKGTIVGRLLKADAPLGNTKVELCYKPTIVGIIELPDTPCSDHALRLSATTDADGKFSFPDAPRHEYSLAYESVKDGKKQWAAALGWNLGVTCCADLKAGETKDVGDLPLR